MNRSLPRPGARQRVPTAAAWLGALGLIPFVTLAVACVSGQPQLPFDRLPALIGYGAVILSFLGGVHWGIALSPDAYRLGAGNIDRLRLAIGIMPALIAWGAMLLQPQAALAVLAAGFFLQFLIDLRGSSRGHLPAWYPRLRGPLTLIVIGSLAAALATFR